MELSTRDKRTVRKVPVAEAVDAVLALKQELFAEIGEKTAALPLM